jgi:TM2 domain-containing membrane protein YozV
LININILSGKTLIVIFLIFSSKFCYSFNDACKQIIYFDSVEFLKADTFITECSLEIEKRPNPLLHLFRMKQRKNKKITAAVLAFPFPFGIVGLHRIYLGCSPYVPVVYIATVGGAFGILPFIDFCAIVLEKDIDRFANNQSVFMWVK